MPSPSLETSSHSSSPGSLTERIEQLSQALRQEKASCISTAVSTRLSAYHNAGCWIPVRINPFIRPKDILYIGVYFDHSPQPDHPGNELYRGKNREDYHTEVVIFDRIMELIPDFSIILKEAVEDFNVLDLLFAYLHGKARSARSDDTKALKSQIVHYMALNNEDKLNVPELNKEKSMSHGFYNAVCARLLCPRRLLPTFDENPEEFMQKVHTKEITIKARDWPTFLYDPNVQYNLLNKDIGLLHGPVFLRVLRHIFTGPTSAMNPQAIKLKRCRSKCDKRKVTSIDRYMLAYAAIQTWFVLCDANSWQPVIKNFNLEKFYNKIVALMEDESDQWVKETVEWIDKQLCLKQLREQEAMGSSNTESDSDDELQEIFMSRMACEQRAKRNAEGNCPPNPHSSGQTVHQNRHANEEDITAQNWAVAYQSDGNEAPISTAHNGDHNDYYSSEADDFDPLDDDDEPPQTQQRNQIFYTGQNVPDAQQFNNLMDMINSPRLRLQKTSNSSGPSGNNKTSHNGNATPRGAMCETSTNGASLSGITGNTVPWGTMHETSNSSSSSSSNNTTRNGNMPPRGAMHEMSNGSGSSGNDNTHNGITIQKGNTRPLSPLTDVENEP